MFTESSKDLHLVEIGNVEVITRESVTRTVFSFLSVLVLTMADGVIRKWE